MEQARKQSQLAKTLKLPLIWHVAEPEFASFLRKFFDSKGWNNIDVRDTPSTK